MPTTTDQPGPATPSARPATSLRTDWGHIWAAHATELSIYARSLAGSPADAEELIQSVLVRLVERRASPEHPRAYLYTCLRRGAIDATRRRDARRAATRTLAVSSDGLARPAPESDRAALHGAIERLPDDQREVVLLHARCGLTLAETAEVLGCPLGTAASRYARALAALRADLQIPDPHESRS